MQKGVYICSTNITKWVYSIVVKKLQSNPIGEYLLNRQDQKCVYANQKSPKSMFMLVIREVKIILDYSRFKV